MKEDSKGFNLFSGLVFWGSNLLPGDIIPSLDNIRKWAFNQKLIWDIESQLVASERIEGLNKHFGPEDKLAILIHLYTDDSGNLNYCEYPYLPIRSLIRMGKEIEIVYWRMIPTTWKSNGTIKDYGEVRFGFYFPGIEGDEFCSASNAKLVVKKFHDLLQYLSANYEVKKLEHEVLDIEVNGEVKAKFFKAGRLFDVELIGRGL